MTLEEIKKLIEVVRETGIAELEVQQGENRVRIRSASFGTPEAVLPPGAPATFVAPPGQTAVIPPTALLQDSVGQPAQALPAKEDDRNVIVKSPIVGTYYDSPSPGAPSFVKIGDQVEAKQVICIIESMKLMNEIEAEASGVIVAKHVENGRPVEYGQSLFTIAPL